MKVFILEDSIYRINLFREIFAPSTVDFVICESVAEAQKKWKPPYDLILLDHDLEDVHYRKYEAGEEINTEDTGYTFAKWLATKADLANSPEFEDIKPEFAPHGVVIIHSFNAGGAERMQGVLSKSGWYVTRKPFGMELLTTLQTMVRPS